MLLNVALPHGESHGWGLVGQHLHKELSELTDVYPVVAGRELVPGPLFRAVTNYTLAPFLPEATAPAGWPDVGYSFIEEPWLAGPFLRDGLARWDHLLAGSSWAAAGLRRIGFPSVSVAVQGVDTGLFRAALYRREDPRQFVIVSAGKAEYRKGTDIAIRAYKIFSDRHPDAFLVAAWGNMWEESMRTLARSPHLAYRHQGRSWQSRLTDLMTEAGIAPERYDLVPVLPNWMMPRQVYQRGDVGLFLSRCEAGTNLPLMECLASEVPAIATYATGHLDVLLTPDRLTVLHGATAEAAEGWFEPDLEEVVAGMEWAYCYRAMLPALGAQGRLAMHQFPWRATAEAVWQVCRSGERPRVQTAT